MPDGMCILEVNELYVHLLPNAWRYVMNTNYPKKDLVNALKKQGMQLDPYRDVQIRDVHYMGDEGGITCDITPVGKETKPVLCSIPHLLIPHEHPLYNEIRKYQEDRA
jgi:hypothetical protein